ncbi:MAG: hypothetical protein IKY63_00285 [Tidjanibacter sp.]|nr:hypothetical protein [Tidjanibacter sp.]
MKKILFLVFAALAFVACDKGEEMSTKFVDFIPRHTNMERARGGKASVIADVPTYPKFIVPYKLQDRSMEENLVSFYKNRTPTEEELRSAGPYEVLGCKITQSEDLMVYTIEVEKDCDWDYIEVWTQELDGNPITSMFRINLSPQVYHFD